MAGHDCFRLANGGQIYARIPAQQEIEICGKLVELGGGKIGRRSISQEGLKKLRNFVVIHRIEIVVGQGSL